jgi:uncharacterized protein (TIGR03437 family)
MILKNLFTLSLTLVFALQLVAQGQLSPFPSFALGYPEDVLAADLSKTNFPNLVEGRELNAPQSVALDPVSGAVYVADTQNNRVLGWSTGAFQNGAPAEIVIGQKDFFTTFAKGPGTDFTSGLRAPTGLAVDSSRNLYVVDAGNNRILRFPNPFSQPEEVQLPDLVIGQSNMLTNAPNNGGLLAGSIRTVGSGNSAYRTGLAFDAAGNLWFTDAGNHRVLRYPSASIGSGSPNGPNADRVLGQPDFESNTTLTLDPASRNSKTALREPSAVAIDASGRLFVADGLNRVAVYEPDQFSSRPASRIMGIAIVQEGENLEPINERTPGVVLNNRWPPPEGLFAIGNKVFVVDTPANRILRFPPYDTWELESETMPSPSAEAVIGQGELSSDRLAPNRDQAEPTASSFSEPVGASVGPGNKVLIADAQNNRALLFPDLSNGPVAAPGEPYAAEAVFGQPGFINRSINRIEGREFFFSTPNGTLSASDLVIDWNSDPPRMYVADPNNNRVLGFADARVVRNGTSADLVIGQAGMFRSLVNSPTNQPLSPNESGLFFPLGVAIDAGGNLFVSDWGNGRVLRFPRPFDQPAGATHKANLVLGQRDFTSRLTDATARFMNAPWGLNFTVEGTLVVTDSSHNRVLQFVPPFENGMAAAKVFGQPDFSSTGSGTTLNRMNGPRGVSTDTNDRMYVVDGGNSRVLVWGDIRLAPNDPQAAIEIAGLRGPSDVFVSRETGKAWVTEIQSSRALRFPQFDELIFGTDPELAVAAAAPLAVAEDPFGNLYVGDALNRITGFFPGLSPTNAASFLPRVSPGMITSVFFPANDTIKLAAASSVPLPTVLDDISVTVDGKMVPLYFVSPGQVNFLMPNGAPSSGIVTVTIFRPSTQQIIASNLIQMAPHSPGAFTRPPTGTGQIAALNQDNTINSAENPEKVGRVVQLFCTGAGYIPGAPPDGHPAVGLNPTPQTPDPVFVGNQRAEVQYSGLAPALVGVWQINIVIPEQTAAGQARVVIVLNSFPSVDPNNPDRTVTTIAVER